MTFFYAIAFFLMVGGCFILLGLSPADFIGQLTSLPIQRKRKLKKAVKESIRPPKIRGIKKIVKDTQDTLKQENKSNRFAQLLTASGILSVIGILISSAMNNLFLAPVLGIGFSLLPFLSILLMATKNRKNLNNALETALSTITSTYIRTDSILKAVAENIDQFDPQVKPTFQRFLIQAEMISSDIPALLEQMKSGIDSDVFHEWIDALELCQEDRNRKSTLLPIVNKLSDMRSVAGELDYLMYKPLQEFVVMALLLIAEIPIIRMMNEEWSNLLMASLAGKIVIAIDAVILIISLVAVIRNTRPVEYRR
ncbi:hypothetical protein [Clostridium sp. KNHs216]|uniref:type II secretion system F family protein n=1 Tax=Clostridium sp. KNHs216 TaxID=1550235 RepID=UPI00115086A8|nr:hypothetical protein [Clostridium sp. KNHs216]TQI68560.1 tight adherence protein B [Clostridium sp. KNHs216]